MDMSYGILAAISGGIGLILISAAGRVVADEFLQWNPSLVKRLMEAAVKRAPESTRERCREEWAAYLNDTPGSLCKLKEAFGFWRSARKMGPHYQFSIQMTALIWLGLSPFTRWVSRCMIDSMFASLSRIANTVNVARGSSSIDDATFVTREKGVEQVRAGLDVTALLISAKSAHDKMLRAKMLLLARGKFHSIQHNEVIPQLKANVSITLRLCRMALKTARGFHQIERLAQKLDTPALKR